MRTIELVGEAPLRGVSIPNGLQTMAELQELVYQLFDVGAVKLGRYKLKSGIDSPVYFDLRVIVSHPKLMSTVSELLWSKAVQHSSEFGCICGVPYTALPLATLISVSHNLPMLIQRKETKDYGTKRSVEGTIVQGTRCLVVEDVISTGGSVLQTAEALRGHGLVVDTAVVLVDRQQGGEGNLRGNGITALSVLTLTQLLEILQDAGKISTATLQEVKAYLAGASSIPISSPAPSPLSYKQRASSSPHPLSHRLLTLMEDKQTNLALSADVKTSEQLIELADKVGPHICLLKTHVDMMTDFTRSTAEKLSQLAAQHNFIIMEDRKFADIGHTVQLQFSSPSLHLTSGWAHLVTCHALPGPGVLEGLKGVAKTGTGCVLVVEMSSQGALTTPEYMKAALAMAEAHPNFVAGLVCRHQPASLPPSLVLMVPGVRLTEGTDSLGQQYLTPEKAVLEQGSDIIIVGRGIYNAPDVAAAAKLYRERAFAAYLKRTRM